MTLHRPALVDDPAKLTAVTDGLIALAARPPGPLPGAPADAPQPGSRPATTRACATPACSRPSRSGYLDFLCLEADAAFVLTDSGGIQEETTALGVRCFTLRDSTERRVTEELGTNTVLGAKPERIAEIPQLLERPKPGEVVPGWDGSAGARAAEVLRAFLSR